MNVVLQPWQLLFAILSGWVHRRQQEIIEFQNAEIISLMQSLCKKRLLLASLPMYTSHATLSADERRACGIADGLVRLSLGIETTADLITDLDEAFQTIEIKR